MSNYLNGLDGVLIAVAEASRQTLRRSAALASCESSVLITGETGSGKTALAHHIHSISPRAAAPVVTLHGLDATVDVFDDALVRASGGTLILESLTEFTSEVQGRLVRFLQKPLSERKARTIATASNDIRDAISTGAFRHDLYFLISELTLAVPPLRDREEDILPLAACFLSGFKGHDEPYALSAASIELLRHYPWPGNIRELFNTLRRAVLLAPSSLINPDLIELDSIGAPAEVEFADLLGTVRDRARRESITIDGRGAFARQRDQAERAILLAALRDGRSTRTDVAQRLGISPRTLRYKLARLRASGMEVPA